ncbi:MAG TPA: DNA-formamidopyrimidine glycosylase family protein [Acidimicrobiales bacterium]|jgi:formamidopyrimidine-DNA glycosylase|nr:DNA-formamidopyrimidine glycosylase family protein [Acidimicrobiales bacterium]
MPELAEVEAYRRLAEHHALHRRVVGVSADDLWYLKRGLSGATAAAVLTGTSFVAARRRGKLLLLDTDVGAVLGLRFGMSGRLVVDGRVNIDKLMYTTEREDPLHDRFTVAFADGGDLRMRDSRRLGGVELDPDEDRLGPDALGVGPAALGRALAASAAPLKARLMDQARLAGVGNLAADEVLWRAGLSPLRPAGSLRGPELRRLAYHLHATLADLIERGGSHAGDLAGERHAGGICPRDGTPLSRAVVGGRTTWWCARHQN